MTARILIVDDERDNRELLAIILDHEGYIVVTAASGAEALAIVAQHPPDAEPCRSQRVLRSLH